MDDLTQRETRTAESILEDERLTADLDDAAANALINWGITCAKTIVQSTAGLDETQAEEAMYPRLRALRRTMRTISRWAAKQQEWDAESSADSLAQIIEQTVIIYGEGYTPPTDNQRNTFLQQQTQFINDPLRLIVNLQEFIKDPVDTSTNQEEEE